MATTAIIRISWKKLPTKMMAIFSTSPIPSQRMNSGMKAEAGMYRTNPTRGSIRASTALKVPINSPSGTPITAAARKPAMTREVLTRMSVANPNWANCSMPASRTRCGVGRKSALTNPP